MAVHSAVTESDTLGGGKILPAERKGNIKTPVVHQAPEPGGKLPVLCWCLGCINVEGGCSCLRATQCQNASCHGTLRESRWLITNWPLINLHWTEFVRFVSFLEVTPERWGRTATLPLLALRFGQCAPKG